MDHVTQEQLQNDLQNVLDQAKKSPVMVTDQEGKPDIVICDIAEYVRLKQPGNQQALWAHELDDDWKERLAQGFQGRDTPEYDDIDK